MDRARQILDGLGGAENIEELESCITRLRIEVKNSDLVDEAALTQAGAFGVIHINTSLQVVIGPTAEELAEQIQALM